MTTPLGILAIPIAILCLLLPASASAAVTYPEAAEQISTTTGIRPQIAIDPQNRATVVYEHNNFVYAVRIQADGSVGIPVKISEQSKPTARVSLYPEVVIDSQGISTVAWARIDAIDADTEKSVGEYARLDADGDLIGAVHEFSEGTYQPELTIDPQDRVSLLWAEFGATLRVMRIAPDGATSAPTVVATGQNLYGGDLSGKRSELIIADPKGRVTVVWGATGAGTNAGVVRARTIAADGFTLGATRSVSSTNLFFIGSIDVAAAPDGSLRVIWMQTIERNGKRQILTRKLNPGGEPTGAPVQLNAAGAEGASPRIEADGAGRWLAAWAQFGTSEVRQVTQLIDAAGNLGTITPQSQAGAYSNRAEVRADSCNRWVMQWESSADGTFEGNHMFAGRLSADGAMQGATRQLSSVGDVDKGHDLAIDSADNPLHVWRGGDNRIMLSRGVDDGSDEGCGSGDGGGGTGDGGTGAGDGGTGDDGGDGGTGDGGTGDGGDTGGGDPGPAGDGGGGGSGDDSATTIVKVKPVFKLGIRSARQVGRRIVVSVRGQLIKRAGRPCQGRAVAVVRTGGQRARRVVKLKGRCAFTRTVRFPVAKLKAKFRPRGEVLLVRANGRYLGSSALSADRAPATRTRVKR